MAAATRRARQRCSTHRRRARLLGEARRGERLPPARDLGAVLGVNTNAVPVHARFAGMVWLTRKSAGRCEVRRGRSLLVALGRYHRKGGDMG